jgi:DNA-binding NarL/FixJ family response regulator
VQRLAPDVLLMDIAMPHLNGIQAGTYNSHARPPARCGWGGRDPATRRTYPSK